MEIGFEHKDFVLSVIHPATFFIADISRNLQLLDLCLPKVLTFIKSQMFSIYKEVGSMR